MLLFIAPQLCASVERPPSGNDWIHEIAFDGYRIQMRVEDGNVTLKTRNGLDWTPKFGAIATAAGALPDCIVDGEIVALDHQGSPDFAGLQASLSDGKTDELIFFAFDLLFLGGQDLRQQSLMDRKQALKGLIEKSFGKDQAEVRYVEHFESGGEAVLKSACRMSLEGIVSKRAAARYASGRTSAWTKSTQPMVFSPPNQRTRFSAISLGRGLSRVAKMTPQRAKKNAQTSIQVIPPERLHSRSRD
jgi:bifunctional non-homologous end joining protein LigD